VKLGVPIGDEFAIEVLWVNRIAMLPELMQRLRSVAPAQLCRRRRTGRRSHFRPYDEHL
jgi:hypothetical protein